MPSVGRTPSGSSLHTTRETNPSTVRSFLLRLSARCFGPLSPSTPANARIAIRGAPRRWSRLVMVAIVIGIVSPIVCLTGTWMIVRAMVEGQMHVTNAEGKGMQDAESFFEQREEMSRPDNSPKELGKQPRALDEEAKKKVPPPPTAGKSVSNPPQSHPESIESKKAVAPAQRQSSSH